MRVWAVFGRAGFVATGHGRWKLLPYGSRLEFPRRSRSSRRQVDDLSSAVADAVGPRFDHRDADCALVAGLARNGWQCIDARSCSRRSWRTGRKGRCGVALPLTTASKRSSAARAWSCRTAWPPRSGCGARACATSRPACPLLDRGRMTWGPDRQWRATRWPTPTRYAGTLEDPIVEPGALCSTVGGRCATWRHQGRVSRMRQALQRGSGCRMRWRSTSPARAGHAVTQAQRLVCRQARQSRMRRRTAVARVAGQRIDPQRRIPDPH